MKLRFFCLVFFCLATMCLNSTEPVIEFRHIGIHNGLSNSQINVIFKDSRGFVWLGTQSGFVYSKDLWWLSVLYAQRSV